MNSHVTAEFRTCFKNLPEHVKRSAKRSYLRWREDPEHPGLRFKRVGKIMPVYSVRVGIGWRALGVIQDNDIVWFWIGSHADYDSLLNTL